MFIRHLSNGAVCCEAQQFSDLCAKCQAALRTAPTGEVPPPNGYDVALKAAAGSKPPTFEDEYKGALVSVNSTTHVAHSTRSTRHCCHV